MKPQQQYPITNNQHSITNSYRTKALPHSIGYWILNIGCWLLLLCLAGLIGPSAPVARADEASDIDAKYQPRVDKMVDAALKYLAASQNAKGYWAAENNQENTAVTGLCTMAFMAKGYTPGAGPYGDNLNRAIDYVLSKQDPKTGLIQANLGHGPMYEHGISTLMLSEVSGMVDPRRQEKIDVALPKAVKLILTAQTVKRTAPLQQGGWRYQSNASDSDISVTGWCLMTLRSARNNGTPIPKKCIDEAVRFVMNCRSPTGPPAKQDPDRVPDKKRPGVGFNYQPAGSDGSGQARTGTAVLCLELAGKHRSGEALDGGDWILAHPYTNYGEAFFYYGLYYCSQAMFQLGGKYWEQFAPSMYEMMEKFQDKKTGAFPRGASNEAAAGINYSTAMGVLALSVSYRQLPIYQR
jgi:hypothetical protein